MGLATIGPSRPPRREYMGCVCDVPLLNCLNGAFCPWRDTRPMFSHAYWANNTLRPGGIFVSVSATTRSSTWKGLTDRTVHWLTEASAALRSAVVIPLTATGTGIELLFGSQFEHLFSACSTHRIVTISWPLSSALS